MLTTLNIKNFALIDTLEIEFREGLSIITGETGAGKSIVLGALGLLQGKRADLGSLKNKDQKCIVEGYFHVANYSIESLFLTLDIEYEPITIIRREISPSGKSRAFVNDSPVNLGTLQDLSNALIDIHSQHQTSDLWTEDYQIQVVDAVGGNRLVLQEYQLKLAVFKRKHTQLNQLKIQREELLKEKDYTSFLLQELVDAALLDLDQTSLEAELNQFSSVELIQENLGQSITVFEQDQVGIVPQLKMVKQFLARICSVSVVYQELYNRIDSIDIELSDVIGEIESALEKTSVDPERMEVITSRLQMLYVLQKKHAVTSVEQLLEIEQGLAEQSFQSDHIEEEIYALEKDIDALHTDLDRLCTLLADNRNNAIEILQFKLTEILQLVGMPNASFQFCFTKSESFLNHGAQHLELLFSANKGMGYGLLKKVASGGEMSRIMLAIKAILAQYSSLPTIIFDEIDTGVSGEVADKMGQIMATMSKDMQVFAITHLVQIASKGKQHYKVFKISDDNTTTSSLVELSKSERIDEIAQMLSGKDISSSATKHAKELLGFK